MTVAAMNQKFLNQDGQWTKTLVTIINQVKHTKQLLPPTMHTLLER